MAIRGENVGTAYIKILADGSGLNRSIRDQFNDKDLFDEFDESGRKASRAWHEAFEEEAKKAPNQTRLRDAIAGPLHRGNWLETVFFRGTNWRRFRAGLTEEFGDAGRLAGDRLEQGLLEGMSFDELNNRLRNLAPELVKAQRELEREQAAGIERRLAALRSQFVFLNREAGQLLAGDRNATSRERLLDLVSQMRDEMHDLNIENSLWVEVLDDQESSLRRVRPRLDAYIRATDRAAAVTGRAFGKGSRNDFLNFIGGVTGGITRLATNLLPRMARGFLNWNQSLAEATREGRGFTFLLGSIGKVAGGLAGAFGGLFVIVGPLLSVLSQLAGVIVALAANISFALVGAVGSLAAVALPAGAAIGVLALAFANLSKAQKEALKNDVRPLVSSFRELADVAAAGVFSNVGRQAERLASVLDRLRPLVRGVGVAVSDMADDWLDSLTSPAFDAWVRDMTRFLPDAVRRLGQIIGNTFSGFGGIFRAMIPFMSDVLDYLVDITDTFADWAQSVRGQREIADFFERTKTSLRDLGDFLGSVRDLFNELVSAGQAAGDSLFGSMSDAIDGWVAAIRANPDILGDWFDSAERFGRVIGNLVVSLGKVFSALDNAFSREFVNTSFTILAESISALASILSGVARMFGIGEDAALGFAGQIAAAGFVMTRFNGILRATATSGFIANLRGAETRMAALAGAARTAGGIGGVLALSQGLQKADTAAGLLLNTLGGAGVGFAIGGPIGALIGGAAGAALSVFSANVERANVHVNDGIPIIRDYASTFDSLTGKVTQATRALVLKDLQQRGAVSRAQALGISTRDLVRATLGEADAIGRVNRALNNASGYAVTYTDALGNQVHAQASSKRELRELNRHWQEQGYWVDQVNTKYANDAARKGLIGDIGAVSVAWRTASKETRRNIIATQDLSSIYKTIPKRKATKIEAEGVVPTARGVAKVADQYDLLPRQVRSIIKALGIDVTLKDIRRVQKDLDATDKKRPTPQLRLDTKNLDSGLRNSRSDVDRFTRGNYTARLNVDNSGARSAISATEAWLNSIQDEIVYVDVRRRGGGVQEFASGGMVTYDQLIRAGEQGPEAVVPLRRNLQQVDPSVRWLSAIAQGKVPVAGSAQKVITIDGLTVVSPSDDPQAVAAAVVNQMAATGYF